MKKLIAKISSAVILMALAIAPVSAANLVIADSLSDDTAGASAVTHTITFTKAGGYAVGDVITVVLDAAFTAVAASTPADIDAGAGVGAADALAVGNTVTYTVTTASADAITIDNITATNPAADTPTVYVYDSTGDMGAVIVPVGNGDEVVVTATVLPIFTFDVTENTPVNFRPLPTDGSTATLADYTTLEVTTNAQGGAIVTAESANGGLYSASANHTIGGATDGIGDLETNGFAITTTDSGLGDAAGSLVGNQEIVTLTTIASTTSIPAYINVNVDYLAEMATQSGTDGVTPAGSDYTDTITYNAVATF